MNKKKLIEVVSIITSILALVMVFMKVLVLDTTNNSIKTDISGMDVVFGNDNSLGFSFSGAVLLLSLIAMVLFSVYVFYQSSQRKQSDMLRIALVAVSVVAGLLFFLIKTSFVLNTKTVLGFDSYEIINKYFKLSVFAIIGGISSIITAILAALGIVVKK